MYTKSHITVHFQCVDCNGCGLYLNKAVYKKNMEIIWIKIDKILFFLCAIPR